MESDNLTHELELDRNAESFTDSNVEQTLSSISSNIELTEEEKEALRKVLIENQPFVLRENT